MIKNNSSAYSSNNAHVSTDCFRQVHKVDPSTRGMWIMSVHSRYCLRLELNIIQPWHATSWAFSTLSVPSSTFELIPREAYRTLSRALLISSQKYFALKQSHTTRSAFWNRYRKSTCQAWPRSSANDEAGKNNELWNSSDCKKLVTKRVPCPLSRRNFRHTY